MAVSFRAVGTWAELIADGAVTIPATPQAGDRMYLFARWKDFSITAQVTSPSGWTKLTEFTDGSTSSGNGLGSVKVACWYRDWQSGDGNPTVDFSANPTNASVVIMVMSKAGGEVWLTPLAVTAAMTNWTTSSQIVSASSSVAVPSGGVVMALIGIRDDSSTMTRPTSGIDDSTGAITWNGNYVESPAAHHSTTTGDDGAADLGYRLVTTGATATLRMTGTLSAAETGAGLWVVQGSATASPQTPVPSTLALTATTFAPTVIATSSVLTDNFNDNSRDTAKWALGSIAFENAAVGVAEANQQIEITPLASQGSPAIYGYKSANTYNFTGKRAQVRIAASIASDVEAWLVVVLDADNYLRTWVAGGVLNTRSRVGAGNTNVGHGTFDFATQFYWRIRHDNSSDEIVWEVGDGGTWTELRRIARPFAITAVSFYLSGGTGGSVTSPALVKFDDFTMNALTQSTPTTAALTTTRFAPSLRLGIIPATQTLTTVRFAPALQIRLTPSAATLTTTTLAPSLNEQLTPSAVSLALATFTPTITATDQVTVTPDTVSLFLSTSTPWVFAGLPFPGTGLLDLFNRANEDPLTGWTKLHTSDNDLKVVSNQLTGPINSRAVFDAITPADDQEVYVSVSGGETSGGAFGRRFYLLLRITGQTSDDATGYYVFALSSVVRLYRIDSFSSLEELASFSLGAPLTAGDQVGARVIGDAFEVWVNIQGSGWHPMATATDSTYPSGKIGLGVGAESNELLVDNFGGGSVVSGQTVVPATLALLMVTFAPSLVRTTVLTPGTLSISISGLSPSATQTVNIVPSPASFSVSGFAPTLAEKITPSVAPLAITLFVPTITATADQSVVPTTASLSLSTVAAKLALAVTPETKPLITTTFAPTIVTPVTTTPGTAGLSVQSFAPTLTTTLTPGPQSLTTTEFAPSLNSGVVPATKNLTIAMFAPSLLLTITPSTQALTLNKFTPTVSVTDQSTVVPSSKALTLSSFAPVILASVSAIPSPASLVISASAPWLIERVVPATASLTISGHAPSLTTQINVNPVTQSLALTAFAPQAALHIRSIPEPQSLTTSSFAPALRSGIIPSTADLALSSSAPAVLVTVSQIPLTATLTLNTFAPSLSGAVTTPTPDTINLVLTTHAPNSVSFIPRGLINIGRENRSIGVSSENKGERISFENHVH